MKVAPLVVILAACAAEGESGERDSSGATRAVDIQYDNSATGLMSTTVQDALDDVVEMARATEQKVERAVIACRYETAAMTFVINGSPLPHVFTPAECGGRLPDAGYQGAISKLDVATCGYRVIGFQVMNAGEPDGPGILLKQIDSSVSCTASARLSVLYFKLD
ncbi:MAG: hypothetical protein H0T46_18690 [Deltaproteobacteria bacterium]|nr:hypothetical protein [Deltaproteobacteria bacterium]